MKGRLVSMKVRPVSCALLALIAALLIAGCSAQPSATQPTTAAAASPTTAAEAPTAAATEAPTVATAEAPTAEATSAATAGATAPAETSTAGSSAEDATPAIVAAATAFLATLSDAEQESVLFDWTDTAQKERWSNLPEGLFERDGLMWADLGEESREALLAVMQTLLSEEGYNRVYAQWQADNALTSSTGGGGPGGGSLLYGTDYYWVALIGTPSETDPWQFQWGGHHVTINATIVGPDVALVPSFIGCQPCTYTDEAGATVTPLADIEAQAFALVNALDDTQQQAAVLGDSTIDLVLGAGEDGRTIESEGLAAAEMTAEQQASLLQLISYYTGLINDEDAAARLAEIEATLDETYFAWYGPTTEGEAAYFRVTGPTIVIEYAPQGGGGDGTGLGGAATNLHIHGIYRDPTNDYGARYTQ